MNKEEMRKILPLIKEWVENEDAELYCQGHIIITPAFDAFLEDYEIRYPKKTIIVNGVEVPAPEKKTPQEGQEYFVPALDDEELYDIYDWWNDNLDRHLFNHGLIYLNKKDAIARAKAMIGIENK